MSRYDRIRHTLLWANSLLRDLGSARRDARPRVAARRARTSRVHVSLIFGVVSIVAWTYRTASSQRPSIFRNTGKAEAEEEEEAEDVSDAFASAVTRRRDAGRGRRRRRVRATLAARGWTHAVAVVDAMATATATSGVMCRRKINSRKGK